MQLAKVGEVEKVISTMSIRDLYLSSQHPILHIQEFLKGALWKEALFALKQVGSGSSAWAHLFHLKNLAAAAAAAAAAVNTNINEQKET
jgi:hypothetical protein